MSTDSEGVEHHRFPPLDRSGVLLGLRAGPLLTLVAGLVLALVALASLPGSLGPAGALGVIVAATVVACWPVAGDVPVQWGPVVASWLLRRGGMPQLDPSPLEGTRTRSGAARDVGVDGAGGAGDGDVGGAGRVAGGRRPTDPRRGSPRRATAPSGISLRCLPASTADLELAVIDDRRCGRSAAVLPVAGPALDLLGIAAQVHHVARWGGVLAAIAREGSGIRRLQWLQSASPADLEPLVVAAAGAPGPTAARRGYGRFVTSEVGSATEQRTLLVVSVAPPRALPGRRPPGGVDEVLRRELRLVRGQLRAADIDVGAALCIDDLVAVLAAGGDLTRSPPKAGAAAAWPTAVDEHWGSVQVDDTWQATYWVAEWPRLPVGPDALAPLLATGAARTLAVTLAPVAPDRAVREAQSARTEGMADDALRARAGFIATARRTREAEAVRRREFELADGHGDFRFSGYLTVAARSLAELEARCGQVEQAARRGAMTLRRLHGRQAEARTWTLPLGRGLS